MHAIVVGSGTNKVAQPIVKAFGNYQNEAPSAREAFVEDIVKQIAARLQPRAPMNRFADVSHQLLPRLRSRAYWDQTRREMGISAAQAQAAIPPIPTMVLYEHFEADLIIDTPNAMRSIGAANLDEWGVSFDVAWEYAINNLYERSQPFQAIRNDNGVSFVAFRDCHDATRLLLPELFAGIQCRGILLAAALTRDMLAIVDSDDFTALTELAVRVKDAPSQPRFISTQLFALGSGSWRPFQFPRDTTANLAKHALFIART
jgi:hypothetical protein